MQLIYCSENIVSFITQILVYKHVATYGMKIKECLTTKQISVGAKFVCAENRFDMGCSRTYKIQFVLNDTSHCIDNCNQMSFFCIKVL